MTEMEIGALNVRIVVFLLPQNLGSHNDDDVSIENLKKKKPLGLSFVVGRESVTITLQNQKKKLYFLLIICITQKQT